MFKRWYFFRAGIFFKRFRALLSHLMTIIQTSSDINYMWLIPCDDASLFSSISLTTQYDFQLFFLSKYDTMRQKSNWCICPPLCMVPIILLSFNCQFPLRNRNKLVTWDVKTLLDSSSQAHVLKCFSESASQRQQRLWSGWSFIPCKIKDTSRYGYFRFKTVFVYLHFLPLHRIKICQVPEWRKKITWQMWGQHMHSSHRDQDIWSMWMGPLTYAR